MFRSFVIFLALTVTATLHAGTPGVKKSFKVDAAQSKLKWIGKKVTGAHEGYVAFKSGEIQVEGKKVLSVSAVVDMTTISCTDLANPEYNAKLVNHLKSDDFFSVEKFSTANFILTSLTEIVGAKSGEPNYKVKGKLTIKGITNDVEFPAYIDVKERLITVRADVVFDRTKFDIKYKSPSVFESIGDKAIYDDVQFSVALVAKLNN